MLGYVIINKSELKFREFDGYQSYYCGLCQTLKKKYGCFGQLTLSYDMTFLILLLTGLYEPKMRKTCCKCIVHPIRKHPTVVNEFTEYGADMNLLLTYYKCMDDWLDEKKYERYAYAKILEKKQRKIADRYQEKAKKIEELLEQLHDYEKKESEDMDAVSGCFGKIMAELFAYKKDGWENSLRQIGFYLGKFIYLMDAYDDLERDLQRGNYNPFRNLSQREDYEAESFRILTMMLAECSREFEQLPIFENVEILRNILYSGVWSRYETLQRKDKETRNEDDVRSI